MREPRAIDLAADLNAAVKNHFFTSDERVWENLPPDTRVNAQGRKKVIHYDLSDSRIVRDTVLVDLKNGIELYVTRHFKNGGLDKHTHEKLCKKKNADSMPAHIENYGLSLSVPYNAPLKLSIKLRSVLAGRPPKGIFSASLMTP